MGPKNRASRWGLYFAPALGVLLGLALVGGCSKSVEVGSKNAEQNIHPLKIDHEACDPNSSSTEKTDANNDGRPEIISVMKNGREVCRISDINNDGKIDRYAYFDDQGRPRRLEVDYGFDGRMDEIVTLSEGVIVTKFWDMSLDGKLDTWQFYESGRLVKQDRDANGDGRVDEWWTYPDPTHLECAVVAYDRDADGRPDPGSQFDMCHPTDEEPANILATSSAYAPKAPAGSASSKPPPPPPPPPSAAPPPPPPPPAP